MSLRVKTLQSQARPRSESGQAIIEYVLMLIISVSLVLALATQIFTPMQEFLKNYMGDYVQCLLEMGELPSLGGEDTTVADEGCNAKFDGATIANGRPSKSSDSSSSSSSSSSSDSKGSGGSGSSSDSESSSGSGTYAGSSSRPGGRSAMLSRNGGTGMDGGASGSGKETQIPVESGPGGGFFASGTNQVIYVRRPSKTTSIGIAGMSEEDRKKIEKKNISEKRRNVATDGEVGPPPKKLLVKPPEAKAIIEKEDSGWSIGNFVRYLFIAAIIIILLLIVGGQALQMSKSMEK